MLSIKKSKRFFVIAIPLLLLLSCGQMDNKQTTIDKKEIQGTTIEVDISNKNTLAILLAKDGTINRKGSALADSTDNDLFMGVTNEKVFDSLMETVSDDLLSYSNKANPFCDTAKQTCRVKISFVSNTSERTIDYCVKGTMNDLPAPIKEYIDNAIKITGSWYQTQKNLIKK